MPNPTPAIQAATAARTWFSRGRDKAWLCLLAAALLQSACSKAPPQVAELAGRTMGTSYSVKLSPAPDERERAALQRQVEQRLQVINQQMSTYLPDSDLMRFNRTGTTDWQAQPAALVTLVEQANRVSELSDGQYDITVGPLVDLWGFGSSGGRDSPPTQQEIDTLLSQVGYQHLQTRLDPPALRKTVADLQVDLSSIAKGWAVDQIAELLRAKGFENFLVEIGGEVLARGEKSSGKPWRIAIEQPSFESRAIQRVIELRNMAMATSGDYRNFFTDGGQIYSHTIDPGTGQSVQHRLASVTVLADNCTTADAWATALMALGDQRAPRRADELGLSALFIIRATNGVLEQPSRALSESGLWRAQLDRPLPRSTTGGD